MWVDDRTNGEGIFPLAASATDTSRINFVQWYEQWLDHALRELAASCALKGPYHFWPNYWWTDLMNETAAAKAHREDLAPPEAGEQPF